MIRLRHLRHPFSSARLLRSRLVRGWNRLLQRWQLRDVRRSRRDVCWCGGALDVFRWHPSYGICEACGSFVNRIPPVEEDLAKIYALGPYWRTRQILKGFPAIDRRADLYLADGRVAKWLELVDAWSRPGVAIEVGCAPGVLLVELKRRGYSCLGVEPDQATAAWVRDQTGIPVVVGMFPRVELPVCQLFLAFDVLEHSPRPLEFMRRAADLLAAGGTAIIQTAVERYGFTPPFGDRFDVFDDLEHLFLFTEPAIDRLADGAGLDVVDRSQRIGLAGELIVLRKRAWQGARSAVDADPIDGCH